MIRTGRVVSVFTRCAHVKHERCDTIIVRLWVPLYAGTDVVMWLPNDPGPIQIGYVALPVRQVGACGGLVTLMASMALMASLVPQ